MTDPVEGSGQAPPVPKAVAKPTAPPPAAKPAAKSKGDSAKPPDPARRRVIWGMIYGYLGINLLMFLRFFFPRALYEPNTIVNIGYPSDFMDGVNQQFLQSNRIWVIKEPGDLFVIFARCTHLGCTPDWLPQQNMFHCPCHGSEYDPEGVNFAGPAPRPMDRAHVEMDPTGKVIVDTSKLYMDDPRAGTNQFNDPGAFLSV
jgi:cytochrome b6-f complex iron-sulfur subunit